MLGVGYIHTYQVCIKTKGQEGHKLARFMTKYLANYMEEITDCYETISFITVLHNA
jgi:hypothetical protein